MTAIWIIITIIIAYGSLFPFDFQAYDLNWATFDLFLRSWQARSSWGDLLGNIILFVPFGIVGMLSTRTLRFVSLNVLLVLVSGLILAVGLQFAQLYLPGRIAALKDAIWNTLGLTLGMFFALVANNYILRLHIKRLAIPLIPLVLLGTWCTYRLIPFVPTIDFQEIKDSLKPLLIHPEISLLAVCINAVSWMLAGYFLKYLPGPGGTLGKLGLLMAGIFGLEVLIVANDVTASNIVGALIALMFSAMFLDRIKGIATMLAILLAISIVLQGLAPFDPRPVIATFNWLPFHGFLGGSMYHNTLALLQKTFLYSSLVFLLYELGLSWLKAALLTGFLLLLIEAAQIYFSGHTPEITDPLLILLLTLGMVELDRLAPVSHKRKNEPCGAKKFF
ncbi:MAG: VanZ family protein [Nitrosomonadaceae bacterium]